MKVEHSGGVKDLTDEQLDAAITAFREMLARQAGESAKVIEREAEVLPALPTPALPPPPPKPKRAGPPLRLVEK
jgi:hypothetical protein